MRAPALVDLIWQKHYTESATRQGVKAVAEKRKRRWYQYRLRTLLLLTTLTAFLLSGVAWRQSTRRQRAVQRAIRESDSISEEEKDLLCSLIWQRDSRELVQHLLLFSSQVEPSDWPLSIRQYCLAWHASFLDVQRRPRRVFLFIGGFRRHSGTIVLTDDRRRLIRWKEVDAGGTFKSASVRTSSGTIELSVIADTGGVYSPDEARGTYRFLLDDDGIIEHGVEWVEAYASRQREKLVDRLPADEVNR
jgi:hypothetical protein